MEILAIYLANSLTMETAYMYHKNRYSEKVPRYVPKQKRTTVYRYTDFTAHLYYRHDRRADSQCRKFDPWCSCVIFPVRGHSRKFDPWCYIPGERTRCRTTYPNTSTEAVEPD